MFGQRSKVVAACVAISFVASGCFLFPSEEPYPELRVGLAAVGSLDPARATSPTAFSLIRTACDGLVSLDPDDGTPQPSLAASWEVSEDLRTFDFAIHKGLTFQDGADVTAQAVAETLSRVVRPTTTSPWRTLLQRVEGYAEVVAEETESLSGVRAIDTETLQIVLSTSYADFPVILAHPGLTPVSPRESSSEFPACSGPYSLLGVSETEIDLVLDEDRDDVSQAYGELDLPPTITAVLYETVSQAFEAFRSGEIDASAVPQNLVASVVGESGYVQRSTNEVTYIAFHPAAGPTMRGQIRTAISTGMNRLIIVDAAFGDGRVPATRWLSENFGESNCDDLNSDAGEPLKAKATLDQAEINPTNVSIPLYFDPSVTDDLVVDALRLQIAGGLGLELVPESQNSEQMAKGAADLKKPGAWIFVHDPDLPTPDRVLGVLFDTTAPENPSKAPVAGFEEAVEKARGTSDSSQRHESFLAAENIACQSVSKIPLWKGMRHWMYDSAAIAFADGNEIDIFGGLVLRRIGAK
jgi:ABC-type transport system substrate-binding protein